MSQEHDIIKEQFIIPGMIDMHVHGSRGADVMDGTLQSLQTIADSLLEQGTTGFLATTMSAPVETLNRVLDTIYRFTQTDHTGARVLGIHLEGPFISPDYVGAQHSDAVQVPSIPQFEAWQKICGNLIKMVTLAPEQPGALDLIRYLRSNGIIVSFGHSAATYEETVAAIDAGVTHATHLFNAMRGIHHRQPGAATAILLSDKVYAELIADGHHLAAPIIDLSYRLKSADKLILVTDATRAQCMDDGEYELGGQPIFLKDNTVRLKNGTLAGSIVTLPEAIRFVMKSTQCTLDDIVKMVSTNPAKQLGIHAFGTVILNQDYEVIKTFL